MSTTVDSKEEEGRTQTLARHFWSFSFRSVMGRANIDTTLGYRWGTLTPGILEHAVVWVAMSDIYVNEGGGGEVGNFISFFGRGVKNAF